MLVTLVTAEHRFSGDQLGFGHAGAASNDFLRRRQRHWRICPAAGRFTQNGIEQRTINNIVFFTVGGRPGKLQVWSLRVGQQFTQVAFFNRDKNTVVRHQRITGASFWQVPYSVTETRGDLRHFDGTHIVDGERFAGDHPTVVYRCLQARILLLRGDFERIMKLRDKRSGDHVLIGIK